MKKYLRKKARAAAAEMSGQYRREASDLICQRVLESGEYRRAEVIFCYVSTADEPDTHTILTDALSKGKKVLVPRCSGKGVMEAVEICSLSDLAAGRYGIYEPLPGIMSTDIGPDLALIPCVCCDRAGNRLGHGGGYYDRFLKNTAVRSMALCFEMLICDSVPVEAHDIKPDAVITESCWR